MGIYASIDAYIPYGVFLDPILGVFFLKKRPPKTMLFLRGIEQNHKKRQKKVHFFLSFFVSEMAPAARRLARGVPPLAGVLARRAAKLRRRAVLGGGKG